MNILDQAKDILYNTKNEKHKEYGNIQDNIKRITSYAKMLGAEVTIQDIFIVLISLKLSRESNAHKEDNILDLVAYLTAYNDFMESK